ncbi:Hsp20/alpha crystallin family protein [Acidihalobacter ferrooxydans]|uniref:Heat-shock protein Hsp20 n=1 Tax=Acidihalobacter ferrooxydans TaxID=1765967 RepID=A0A1P8UJ24_9GAMM|nr:Hsp20/alpha crystallin family protein [Acidihalobacter ferrooxydans]APZ43822.1 heat-shock protein Hsp20 [Acidihalobacter ferrooxydans]
MASLPQLREGLDHAWDYLMDGWQRLYRRASSAITRFVPVHVASDDKTTGLTQRNAGWGVLAAEVYDSDDMLYVRLEAPGLNTRDFDLLVDDGYLVVRGEKRFEQQRKHGRYHMTECAYGRFERAIALPTQVEADKARAHYRDGVLEVEIPKAPQARRRRLSVEMH